MNNRRQRVDTITGETSLMSTPAPGVPDHIELSPEAKIVWDSIIGTRAATSWTKVDLEHASNLANCLADIERLRREVREEGDIVINARGTPIMNPKHNLLESLSRRSVALSRLLHVHPEATAGNSRDEIPRNAHAKKTNTLKNETLEDDGDDLIASPIH